MCGIVGYLGKRTVVPVLIDGLRYLEYRGYDSAGIAFLQNDQQAFAVYKKSGKLSNLEAILPPNVFEPNGHQLHVGIGHIRWATHGAPTDLNAHPHLGAQGDIALVHNGIIENYGEIRQQLTAQGYVFQSQTDTECVAHLLESAMAQALGAAPEIDFLETIRRAFSQLRGAYALTIANRKFPDRLYVVRNHAPLVIGVGDQEYMVASDSVAVSSVVDRVVYLKDREIAEISPQGIRLMTLDGVLLEPRVDVLQSGPLLIDKKGFKHFMLKEIYEQPDVLRNSLSGRLLSADHPVQLFDESDSVMERLLTAKRLLIIGCGTSYNAGLVGKYFIEEVARIPVQVEAAGEFRYRKPVLDADTLVVAISQSGETADTLEAIRLAQLQGAATLVLTNREDSTMARETDAVLSVRAGVEVSVCATKSFLAQVVVLYLLGLFLAERRQTLSPEALTELKSGLVRLPIALEALLSDTEPIQALAKKYGHARDVLFIARGVNYPVALEGALKLKEISYIHAEGYSGSELKHGPIAMLDESIPVVSVLVPGPVFDKMLSNCQEAKAREARVIGIIASNAPPESLSEEIRQVFEDVVIIPAVEELLSPLLTTVPLQLVAYYMAEYLGKDVDQPRNLAKSVTVE
ncbi:MAG: glutamine--fructose-6-phosphate transaminase (isomerizing) [Candidatus Melainabacteria bacterium]|nr:glutamine--fructose-6-phosphate transaminase (isomerizing) [Candidatus Melainabacteria bacterium]